MVLVVVMDGARCGIEGCGCSKGFGVEGLRLMLGLGLG